MREKVNFQIEWEKEREKLLFIKPAAANKLNVVACVCYSFVGNTKGRMRKKEKEEDENCVSGKHFRN